MKEQFNDFQPRAFGVVRFINSDKFVMFFAQTSNVCDHIYHQLHSFYSRICCPSWQEAVVSQRLQFDFKNTKILAMAEGYKLITVELIHYNSCFNVRKQTFCEITNQFAEYKKLLYESNLM